MSTTASLATKWLVSRVAAFQDTHPGIEVRITTSAHLVDFRRDDVDIAVRYGRGIWPGLHADWLMAEHIFPGVQPGAAQRPQTAATTRGSRASHPVAYDGLTRGLAVLADGLGSAAIDRNPTGLDVRSGLHGGAGRHGRAWGRPGTDASRGGRHRRRPLLAPFDMVLPQDAGYYVVTPEATADAPKIALFRDWLISSATPGDLASSPS